MSSSTTPKKSQTYLITGASSGIGLELVKQLTARGDKVFATCRKRTGSATGKDLISELKGDVTVLEGIDVTSDGVGALLAKALHGITIDVLVNNAGGYEGRAVDANKDEEKSAAFSMGSQDLGAVSMDMMRNAFELNALGPLRVQQALLPNMITGGKAAVISTGLASIGDNTSGGKYAYRASKAAVNMIFKSLSSDLKERGIAVACVAPGFVQTEFGPGKEAMTKWGAMPVDRSVRGILKALDGLTLETSGNFVTVPSDGSDPKPMPW